MSIDRLSLELPVNDRNQYNKSIVVLRRAVNGLLANTHCLETYYSVMTALTEIVSNCQDHGHDPTIKAIVERNGQCISCCVIAKSQANNHDVIFKLLQEAKELQSNKKLQSEIAQRDCLRKRGTLLVRAYASKTIQMGDCYFVSFCHTR